MDLDTLMSDLDAAIFARAGRPVSRDERDPMEVKLERDKDSRYFEGQYQDEQARKAGAR